VTDLLTIEGVDRALVQAGMDVHEVRALEELAEAAKRYASSHEQRVAAGVAKLRIARHGGRILIGMAARGQRSTGGKPSRDGSVSTLQDLGLSANRSSRWQAIARLTEGAYLRREDAIRCLDADAELARPPRVVHNSGEQEWYTPPAVIEAARAVMGAIDLDPASCPKANEVVGATTFYTAQDDGLGQPWAGRVWLNPPYAQPLIAKFGDKLVEELRVGGIVEALVLVNNATETGWFQQLLELAAGICFPRGRVHFWHPDRDGDGALQGQAILYFGAGVAGFCAEFQRFGYVTPLLANLTRPPETTRQPRRAA
jgi:ParB family chromosome partitioning protein